MINLPYRNINATKFHHELNSVFSYRPGALVYYKRESNISHFFLFSFLFFSYRFTNNHEGITSGLKL